MFMYEDVSLRSDEFSESDNNQVSVFDEELTKTFEEFDRDIGFDRAIGNLR